MTGTLGSHTPADPTGREPDPTERRKGMARWLSSDVPEWVVGVLLLVGLPALMLPRDRPAYP